MSSAIVPGGVFPDYALPDHEGSVQRFSGLGNAEADRVSEGRHGTYAHGCRARDAPDLP